MVGSTIGKYHVLDRIGRGGMGTVYRAVDETLHRDVAIKVLNSELNDPEVAKRFRAEAVTVARLSHPGIATIYELFQHDGQWMMVMEFVRGETLEHMVERMGPLSPQRAAELCMQALTALAHAHSMGVIHRDLKPANLMITESGAVKIMDFGIARVTGSEHLTSAGFMMGTPAYMAPEQVLGHEIDARADLYAVGVVFYRLTTAKLPFKGDTPFAMAQSQVNDPPTPLGMLRSDLPPWSDQIVTRALAKAPGDRFQSAVEFYEAFSRCLAGLSMTAPYGSSAPTELLHTPARPMATGAVPQGTWPGPASGPMATGGQSLPPAYGSEAASRVTASGQTLQPTATPGPQATGAAPAGTGQTVAAQPAAAPPAAAAAAPRPAAGKGGNNALSLVLGAAVIILAAVLGVLWLRTRSHPTEAPPAPTTEAVATTPAPTTVVPEPPSTVQTPEATPGAAATTPGVLVPNAATAPASAPTSSTPPGSASSVPPAGGGATPTATPRSGAPAPSATSGTSARATPAATPSSQPGARSDARGTGARQTAPPVVTTPTPTPVATPAEPVDTPRRPAATPTPTVSDEPLAFTNVKLLSVLGKKTQDQDVLLSLVGGQISIAAKSGGSALLQLPYKNVVHATYIHAHDPKWDATLPSPTEKLDMPGLIHTSKHWLTLQTRSEYVILRLEDDNWLRITNAIEARTGVKVDRLVDK